mmetsp:Transcript_28416/g.65912  ORF Transcript_28416/g.65912 Transcript_28416/m.65912 type:complete len:323 (+) Transcript_28416:295-1263(+)
MDLLAAVVLVSACNNGLDAGVDPRELDPMSVAGDKLPTTAIRQGDMSSAACADCCAGTSLTLRVVFQALGNSTAICCHHCQHLEIVAVCLLPVAIYCVGDCVPHGTHHCSAVGSTEFSHHLKLLWHFLVLKLLWNELKSKVLRAAADNLERVGPQAVCGPFVDQGLQTEVRAHDCEASSNSIPHEPHRDGGPHGKTEKPSRAARKWLLRTAGGAALPVEHHTVGRHRLDVLHQGLPHLRARGGCCSEVQVQILDGLAADAVGAHALAVNCHWLHFAEHWIVRASRGDGHNDANQLVIDVLLAGEQLAGGCSCRGSSLSAAAR